MGADLRGLPINRRDKSRQLIILWRMESSEVYKTKHFRFDAFALGFDNQLFYPFDIRVHRSLGPGGYVRAKQVISW